MAKSNTKEENKLHMKDLMPLIKGKCAEIALKHDASRIVQAAVKLGSTEDRRIIVNELCQGEILVELSKAQYAHFCVLKVIKYCHSDQECAKMILKALQGHMPRLFVHSVGSRVLEVLFANFTSKQTARLKQELYGPHFAFFTADLGDQVPTLQSNIARLPDKKQAAIEYIGSLVNKGMQKTLYSFQHFQNIMAEYVDEVQGNEIRAMASAAADHTIHLLSSRAGTRVTAAMISYGTAKDRKRIMKSLKGYAVSGLLHKDAYLAIIRLVQLTDDTVSIQKNVLYEIVTKAKEGENEGKSRLLDVALSETGSKLLLLILAKKKETRDKFFDPYELSVLFENPMVKEDGQMVPTSKKDEELRRSELLKSLKEPLLELCTESSKELLRSRPGSLILREVYETFGPTEELVKTMVSACGDGDDLSIFQDAIGHLAVKNMILVDKDSKANGLTFSSFFLKEFGSKLNDICKSNRGAFVVSALLQCPHNRKAVSKHIDERALQQACKQGEDVTTAGYEALLKEIKSA